MNCVLDLTIRNAQAQYILCIMVAVFSFAVYLGQYTLA